MRNIAEKVTEALQLINTGVDVCEVEAEIVVHKKLNMDDSLEAFWNDFLEGPYWHASADFSRYFNLEKTLITADNGVDLPLEDQFYVYKLHTIFGLADLFTKERLEYMLRYNFDLMSNSPYSVEIISGYEEALAKFKLEGNNGSTTDKYQILLTGADNITYVAEIEIVVKKSLNLGSGQNYWDDLLTNLPIETYNEVYAEHTEIIADDNKPLDETFWVHKLHVTMGPSDNFTKENLERLLSKTFYGNLTMIAPPTITILSGFEEALEDYKGIGDGQAVTNTIKFRYSFIYRDRQIHESIIEGQIVVHKDLSFRATERQAVADGWQNYIETDLPQNSSLRTYAEHALIKVVNGNPLPPSQYYYTYKIHTQFGRSSSFTKESLEKLLEQSYLSSTGKSVDISIINGFETASAKYRQEGDGDRITEKFTLQIREKTASSNVYAYTTEEVDIVVHKNIALELRLPGDWNEYLNTANDNTLDTYVQKFTYYNPVRYRIHTSFAENPSFTKEALENKLKQSYKDAMGEDISVTIDSGYEEAFAGYKSLSDGGIVTKTYTLSLGRGINSYSVQIEISVHKDLSRCTSYVQGVCPACGAKLGDINDDGLVNAADSYCIRQYLAGNHCDEFDFNLADIDRDGSVTSADSLLLHRILSGTYVW